MFSFWSACKCSPRRPLLSPQVAGMFSFWSADVIESRARMELKALKRREDALASGQSALKARTTLIANDDDSDCATDNDRFPWRSGLLKDSVRRSLPLMDLPWISPDGFPHQVEIEKLKLDHEREIAELRLEHQKHLERQLTVLTGSAEQVKAMHTEQQKEERIERIRLRVRAAG